MKKALLQWLQSSWSLQQLAVPGNNSTNTSAPSATQNSEAVTTVSILAKDFAPDDPNVQKLIKGIEDGMKAEGKNVKLQITPVQSGTYSEKMGLLLQSGNIPDLIYFQGGDYQFATTQKILEDLTPYIDKSKYVKASMNPYNIERMKNYPYLLWLSPVNSAIPVVRQDLMDKTTSGKSSFGKPNNR